MLVGFFLIVIKINTELVKYKMIVHVTRYHLSNPLEWVLLAGRLQLPPERQEEEEEEAAAGQTDAAWPLPAPQPRTTAASPSLWEALEQRNHHGSQRGGPAAHRPREGRSLEGHRL